MASMGWMVPISLLANMTDTSAVSSRMAAATSSTRTTPFSCTSSSVTSKPSLRSLSSVCSTAWCSNFVDIRCFFPFASAVSGGGDDGLIVSLAAAGGEHDLARVGSADQLRDLGAAGEQMLGRLLPEGVERAGDCRRSRQNTEAWLPLRRGIVLWLPHCLRRRA